MHCCWKYSTYLCQCAAVVVVHCCCSGACDAVCKNCETALWQMVEISSPVSTMNCRVTFCWPRQLTTHGAPQYILCVLSFSLLHLCQLRDLLVASCEPLLQPLYFVCLRCMTKHIFVLAGVLQSQNF